jgi:hypothetical protein
MAQGKLFLDFWVLAVSPGDRASGFSTTFPGKSIM